MDRVDLHGIDERSPASSLAAQVSRMADEVKALRERLAALDAAEEHHRVELDAARAEAAEARAALKEWQMKAEEWRRQGKEARGRLKLAEAQRRRAEDERAVVIAALGRRGRRRLDQSH
jgi:hypothetical protein